MNARGREDAGVLPLPCLYKDLRGSSWYDRLLVAEFDIRLDHYPDRKTLIDGELPDSLRRGKAWEEYKKILLSLKPGSSKEAKDKDERSPWDYTVSFRRQRARLFPDLESPRPLSTGDGCGTGARSGSWNAFLSALESKEMIIRKDEERIKSRWEYAKRRILVPSGRSLSPLECRLLQRGEWKLVVSSDPAWALPRPGDVRGSGLPFLEISNPGELEGDKDDFILCAHPWLLFSLDSATALVDETEWFFRAYFRRSRQYGDGGIRWPEVSAYGSLCRKVPRERSRRHLMPARRFLEMKPSSFIHPCETKPLMPPEGERSFFRKKGGEWESCPPPGTTESGAVVHAAWVRFPETDFDVAPYIADRPVSPLEIRLRGRGFISTFNYYMTDNLKNLYLESSETGSGEKEILEGWDNNLLDFIRTDDRPLSLPLYSKAFLGRDLRGRLHAFHARPSVIRVTWEGGAATLSEDKINPEGNPESAIYLPSRGPRNVAEGRDCLLIYQDMGMVRRCGPVAIPPFGAVLCAPSLPPEGIRLRWSIELKGDPAKGHWDWLFGGFNLLISKGVNLYRNSADGNRLLDREGWNNPLSRQTQETQLIPDVRQPRSVLGRSRKGEILLLTVSGRSRLSAGAGFGDLSSLAMHICGRKEDDKELEFLVNLDGGASAALTSFHENESTVLSYPAPSDANPPGVPRPVPSLLICREKTSAQ